MSENSIIIGVIRGASPATQQIVLPVVAGERASFGRYKECAVRIGINFVTEMHAMVYSIKVKEDHYIPFIRDYSEKGTFLNKRLIGKRRSAALFSGCLITIAHPELQFFYVSREVIGGPEDEPFLDAPLLYTERLKRNHGHWDLIRLPDQLGYIRDKVGGVYLSIPYALPEGTQAFQLACKVIRAPPHPIPGTDNSYMRFLIEVEILKQCRHPQIPILVEYGVKQVNKFYFCHMFTPLAAGGTLKNLIDRSRGQSVHGIERSKALFIFLQLLEGINYLHNAGRPKREASYFPGGPKLTPDTNEGPQMSYYHGDIKPANILIMEDTDYPHVVINDFGCAKPLQDNLYLGDEGTQAYWPPERFEYREYSIKELQAIDIFGLGVTFYEMVAARHPFIPPSMGNSITQLHVGLLRRRPSYLHGQWRNYYIEDADFVASMLEPELENRATAAKLLQRLLEYTSHENSNYHRMANFWDMYVADREMYQGNVLVTSLCEDFLSEDEINEIRQQSEWFVTYKSPRNDPDRRPLSDDDFETLAMISNDPSTKPLEFSNGDTMDPDVQLMEGMLEGMHLRDTISLQTPYHSNTQTMDQESNGVTVDRDTHTINDIPPEQ